ncbi:MAG: 50S ribosomal protein L25 [Proteobacteria bacterium]|nr:50S ribosomal protein L25 [Pseudomonadota bacterium]
MEKQSLSLKVRSESGKSASKKMRREGVIPAIVYGHNRPNVLAKISAKDAIQLLKQKNKAVYYEISDGDLPLKGKKLLVKDIVKNPISDEILHIDFYEIAEKEPVKMTVPVRLKGKPEGVTKGGILEWERREIEIKASPENVPDFIEIDISSLDIGDSIHLEDLKLPKGVCFVGDPKNPVVTVLAPKEEVELTEEEKRAKLEASLAEPAKE